MPPPDSELGKSNLAGYLCALAIFLSAFLLFQVQPLISKMILPWFGGSPAVWTTCMLFFQVTLLAGYAYADWVSRRPAIYQLVIHAGLMVLACLLLPITRAESLRPGDSTNPVLKILVLLFVVVGLPYLVLSATGPLVQSWFARLLPRRSPFRLYALSNFGSLLALLSYPVVFEPLLGVHVQGIAWSVGFVVFAIVLLLVAMLQRKVSAVAPAPSDEALQVKHGNQAQVGRRIPRRWLNWFLLPALASVMLLAVTNQLCQNVAVVPMLWIAPLSVYLLSFIICFDKERLYVRRWWAMVAILCVVLVSKTLLANSFGGTTWYFEPEWIRKISNHQLVQIGLYIVGLFAVCMLCHGEAVRAKPPKHVLTSFYLWLAGGGAFGGILVSLVCPFLFSSFVELNLGLVFSFLLAVVLFQNDVRETWLRRTTLRYSFVFMTMLGLITVVGAQVGSLLPKANQLAITRNFYGVLTVAQELSADPTNSAKTMYSGAPMHGSMTMHGKQYPEGTLRREPTLYYSRLSGVGVTLEHFSRGQDGSRGLKVGVIGLGVGTVACYAQPGDTYRFYEINPIVEELARKHFTYLTDCESECEVILGDGRAVLESESPQQYDVLIVDAFSGDTIPTHLLTREAFALYLDKHLKPNGVLAVHASNRHMNLVPVVALQADYANIPCVLCQSTPEDKVWIYSSRWLLLTRNESFLGEAAVAAVAQKLPAEAYSGLLWTDQRTSVFRLLLRGPKHLKDELKSAPFLSLVKP